MPNITVTVAAEGMPKFNRLQIMKSAWARYRDIRASDSKVQIERGVVDASFSTCLKMEWRVAKADAAKAARQRKIDSLLSSPLADRMRDLLSALEEVEDLPFRLRAADRRAAIETQIEALIGEAA